MPKPLDFFTCKSCGTEKSISEFIPHEGTGKPRPYCKSCCHEIRQIPRIYEETFEDAFEDAFEEQHRFYREVALRAEKVRVAKLAEDVLKAEAREWRRNNPLPTRLPPRGEAWNPQIWVREIEFQNKYWGLDWEYVPTDSAYLVRRDRMHAAEGFCTEEDIVYIRTHQDDRCAICGGP